MTNTKTLFITILIITNLLLLHCHKGQFNSNLERKEGRENFPRSRDFQPEYGFDKENGAISGSQPYLMSQEEDSKEYIFENDDNFMRRERNNEDFFKDRRKFQDHRGRNSFLHIFGFISLILLGFSALFGAVKLINGYLRKKHIKEYNEWKQYKLKIDEAHENINNINIQNVNRNAVLNNPSNYHVANNSGYSYINLGRSLRNDFNSSY